MGLLTLEMVPAGRTNSSSVETPPHLFQVSGQIISTRKLKEIERRR